LGPTNPADNPHDAETNEIDAEEYFVTEFEFLRNVALKVAASEGSESIPEGFVVKRLEQETQAAARRFLRSYAQPPINAEFLLHVLLKKDEREAIIGDLTEDYAKKVGRLGVRLANRWFYAEVIRTLWPLLKRCFLKISAIGGLTAFVRRLIG
jgi:hypothetical protein